ncbi:MAG: hypothetical protein F6K24_24375 [Okeania sp. SIO2D1]|nr:hypothetical protein [Okeania sp. SIO1I7]NEN92478.1 hypothetical protein [Okeania sp. SIO3H1]NEP79184.1 hypothetical protein [Okeania sp. SIO3B3]NES68148.1 hypothetical protein [Okeania sp. SIO2D1]NET26594.1 hypothetical protein [Okeania sp. SIO1I7]
MPFPKKHKLGFTTDRKQSLTTTVCFKTDEELAQKLKSVPDWQEKLRQVLPDLIKGWTAG